MILTVITLSKHLFYFMLFLRITTGNNEINTTSAETHTHLIYLKVADGLLQAAVMVQHHSSELKRLDVVLIQ